MHQSLVKFSESEASNHTPFLAGFTTTTPELKFSVHTHTGAGMQHVVRTVVYVVDMADTQHIARAHSEAFDQIRPASTLVHVGTLYAGLRTGRDRSNGDHLRPLTGQPGLAI